MRIAVVAVGGNALLPHDTDEETQRAHMARLCLGLREILAKGYELVLTHGNGPQVGNLLIQNEMARRSVPPLTLDACVAETQAQIGYQLQQGLSTALRKHRVRKRIVTVITQVVVSPRDRAFKEPTKPVGPFYSKTRSKELMRKKRWKMVQDPRGGYRRLVPSPRPLDIVEKDVIMDILKAGDIAIAVGGGGIPVARNKKGLRGVEAVVDKDLASSLLARIIGAELLVIVTDVDSVFLDFKTTEERALSRLTVSEAKKYLGEGQFPPGSMGPKLEAAIEFLEHGNSKKKRKVIITSMSALPLALNGKSGTLVET